MLDGSDLHFAVTQNAIRDQELLVDKINCHL